MKSMLILTFLLAAAMAVCARGSLLESVLQEMEAEKQDINYPGDDEETALAEVSSQVQNECMQVFCLLVYM